MSPRSVCLLWFLRTVIRIIIQPCLNLRKPIPQRPRIQKLAARVAEMPRVILFVDLSGHQAHTGIELDRSVVEPDSMSVYQYPAYLSNHPSLSLSFQVWKQGRTY